MLPLHGVKSLSFCFDYILALHLLASSITVYLSFSVSKSLYQGSASVPCRRHPRTFIRETALLIKELIFSLLSLISIVNLKHCEFFKFSFLLSKREREEEKMEMGDI